MPSKGLILLVEDEELLRIMIAEQLLEDGWDVVEAPNGDAAQWLVSADPEISAVVTDIRMPGATNGLALARFVRERWPGMPVIVMSADAPNDLHALLPDVIFLQKPYVFARLAAELKRLVGCRN